MPAPRAGARRSWLRVAGGAALIAGPVTLIGLVFGFALSGDEGGEEHRLHWVSHLIGAPAGLAAMTALCGVLLLEGRHLGRIGRVAAVVAALAAGVGATGGALVGWAGGVQGITDGGLYHLGHGIDDLGAVGIPAVLVLSLVVISRAETLPRWSGWIPFAALPVAAVAGIVMGTLGFDGGTAFVIFLLAPSVQMVVWGLAMLEAATRDRERPLPTGTVPAP